MSIEDAKRFVDETTKDRKLMEQVKAVGIEDGEDTAAFFARAAKGFGFDFSAEEVQEALMAQQEAGLDFVDGAELDEDELDMIAGGWCWTNNLCSNLINYRKESSKCKYTYKPGEDCIVTDSCSGSIARYCSSDHL